MICWIKVGPTVTSQGLVWIGKRGFPISRWEIRWNDRRNQYMKVGGLWMALVMLKFIHLQQTKKEHDEWCRIFCPAFFLCERFLLLVGFWKCGQKNPGMNPSIKTSSAWFNMLDLQNFCWSVTKNSTRTWAGEVPSSEKITRSDRCVTDAVDWKFQDNWPCCSCWDAKIYWSFCPESGGFWWKEFRWGWFKATKSSAKHFTHFLVEIRLFFQTSLKLQAFFLYKKPCPLTAVWKSATPEACTVAPSFGKLNRWKFRYVGRFFVLMPAKSRWKSCLIWNHEIWWSKLVGFHL